MIKSFKACFWTLTKGRYLQNSYGYHYRLVALTPQFTLIPLYYCSNLPFGVYSLHPAFSKQPEPTDNKDDKLHSVSQRFIYQDPQYESTMGQKSKKPTSKAKPQPKQKMTVRLRPRKVLCSNCKGICNENNENVDVLSKKRKLDSDDDAPRVSESYRVQSKFLMGSMLIPKLSRLQPSEITSAISGTSKNSNKILDKGKSVRNSNETPAQEVAFVSVPDSEDTDNQEQKEESDISFSSMFSSARTLKICFGEGEGTVVKIPALVGDYNEDSGVSCDMNKPDSKAAKKALKKAKKQAKKTEKHLPESPKYIGALSPRNNVSNPPSSEHLEKKHKHKVKHKKKNKVQKKRDENTSKGSDSETFDYFSDIKEHCMKQKLSISLRRLSSNSYEKRADSEILDNSDDWESEIVPDFPMNSTESVGGRLLRVSPGDIVWGKVIGFPWWPGRVLSVTSSSRALVAWYASTTSSLMPCDSLSPFLEDYKVSQISSLGIQHCKCTIDQHF